MKDYLDTIVKLPLERNKGKNQGAKCSLDEIKSFQILTEQPN